MSCEPFFFFLKKCKLQITVNTFAACRAKQLEEKIIFDVWR